MDTPIVDFVKKYADGDIVRLHMPGHKGKDFIGCEKYDITEIMGADSLYEAQGIIAKSEENASRIFGTARTVFSVEGSSQCIRAMVSLAVMGRKENMSRVILAARNAHRAFIYACALADADIEWLYPESGNNSICSCEISSEILENKLHKMDAVPAAVYVTTPDYLGNRLDIASLSEVCHRYGTILIVDNAHGAFLHFLKNPAHPMDLGADMCCDSAHKTLPALTGAAYLHINADAPEFFMENAKTAMAMFGSTSPSYLILSSLDMCNKYLYESCAEELDGCVKHVQTLKNELAKNGWKLIGNEPLKITVAAPDKMSGSKLADKLRANGVECEYADPEYVVLMITPHNDKYGLDKAVKALGINNLPYNDVTLPIIVSKKAMSVRQALFSKSETVNVKDSVGRICAYPTVCCPPAITIVVSGEIITGEAIELFNYYGIDSVNVLKQ